MQDEKGSKTVPKIQLLMQEKNGAPSKQKQNDKEKSAMVNASTMSTVTKDSQPLKTKFVEDEIDDTKEKQPSRELTCVSIPFLWICDPYPYKLNFSLQPETGPLLNFINPIHEFKAFTNKQPQKKC